MRSRSQTIMRTFMVLLIPVILFAFMIMVSTFISLAAGEEDQGQGKEITIEVVEDIPAADIEEKEVPLAAYPVSEKGNAVRHISMMLVLLVLVIAYSIYFIRFEKRLVTLRQKAAGAEIAAMQRRRGTEASHER